MNTHIQKTRKPNIYYWFIVVFALLFLAFILNGCIGPVSQLPGYEKTKAHWTVMIFLNGDNDLDNQAIADLHSMEIVGSSDKVNILVQHDSLQGPAIRYFVEKDSDPLKMNSKVLQHLGEINMGDANNLVDFIRFCAQNYPADKYVLILWNHGSGFKGKNISFDQTSNNDSITIPELGQALLRAKSILSKPINLLGMDACLMAMIEVAYEVRESSNLMVASQESVPGDGWDYATFLESLVTNPTMNENQLAYIIADSFMSQFPLQDVNISVTDLNQLEELTTSIGQLSKAILSDNQTSPQIYIEVGDTSQYYSDYDFIDLGDFSQLLATNSRVRSSEVKSAAFTINTFLSRVVLYNRIHGSGVENSHGLSIYFPYKSYNPQYELLAFNRETFWNQVVLKLFAFRKK
ncbi:MAG: hypothetical protein GX428_08760 [Candidatus Atribacteria bacterium]|nr:hypothetical protein [Candidatus Atribacteria bacterium]